MSADSNTRRRRPPGRQDEPAQPPERDARTDHDHDTVKDDLKSKAAPDQHRPRPLPDHRLDHRLDHALLLDAVPWPVLVTALVLVRVAGALWSPIQDCDETFNYWEPTHWLATGASAGLQPWEYAPQYALRSWLYLGPHAALAAAVIQVAGKWHALWALRTTLALASAVAELTLVMALDRAERAWSTRKRTAKLALIFLAAAPGMFHAAPAFLPSSFAMVLTTLALAAWYLAECDVHDPHRVSARVITAIGAAALLGWPFVALLGVPYALPRVLTVRFWTVTVIVLIALAVPLVVVDTYFYRGQPFWSLPMRDWVFAPLNLIVYNVFRNQSALYGTEPATYYLKSLLLNWTPLGVFAAALGLVAIAHQFRSSLELPAATSGHAPATMAVLWLAVMLAQPHKEERFLSPIYPAVALLASQGVAAMAHRVRTVAFLVVVTTVTLGSLRSLALVRYYGAPLQLDWNRHDVVKALQGKTVCLGNDWFLAPGHWVLPSTTRIEFVKHGFEGQLPAHFAPSNTTSSIARVVHGTMARDHALFNDANRMEPSRFVDLDQCDFILGRDAIGIAGSNGVEGMCARMLDLEKTPLLARVIYHPAFAPLAHKHVWQQYCLHQNSRSTPDMG
ncbi:mannosyltransferase [Allomyces javanicus]|nr:mannosyltransferase [Allomyces javanicus]